MRLLVIDDDSAARKLNVREILAKPPDMKRVRAEAAQEAARRAMMMMRENSGDRGVSDVSTFALPAFAGFDFLESLFSPGSSDSEKAAYVARLLQIALSPDDQTCRQR